MSWLIPVEVSTGRAVVGIAAVYGGTEVTKHKRIAQNTSEKLKR